MPWEPETYVSVAEFKAYARIDDDVDDTQIAAALAMATASVNKQCGRQFGQVAAAEAREYTAHWSPSRGCWLVEVDDVQNVTGLAVTFDTAADGTFSTVLTPTAVVPWPRNAVLKGKPYERLLFRSSVTVDGRGSGVRVSALWGWTATPNGVKGAVSLQTNRMHARRDAPFGVAGSPEQGSELRLLAKLDPDVVVALERFKRRAWFR